MAHSLRLLVVTDLDGTLLDHHHYGYQAAKPALARLRHLDIPVILNTSKTAAELAPLRQELNNDAPFVVENGAALFWPADFEPAECDSSLPKDGAGPSVIMGHRMHAFGASRDTILDALAQIRSETGIKLQGFADWDADTLMAHTGLDRDRAERALQRHFSEPLLWQGSPAEFKQLEQAVAAYGLRLLMGGRFLHVVGQSDKGRCLTTLKRAYAKRWGMEGGELPLVIALGDGGNDVAMLEDADHPVLVRSPVNPLPVLSEAVRARTTVTEHCGPQGWNHAIHRLLDGYQFP